MNYAFDPVGNRTTVTDNGTATPYTANALNQYTAIDSLAAPAYDANGNLTTLQTATNAPVWTYSYDAQNRLIGGTSTAGSTFSFAYDARNRCVARTFNGTATCHLYDGWNLIEDRTAADTSLAEYYHGATVDEIIATVKPAGPFFHHHDGLGSVTALSDNTGAITERSTYDIYGTPAFKDATGATIPDSLAGNRLLFTGRELLAGGGDTTLYDYRNRAYSAVVGRFAQTDPIRFAAQDTNIYRYVYNTITVSRDPFGLAIFGPDLPRPCIPGDIITLGTTQWCVYLMKGAIPCPGKRFCKQSYICIRDGTGYDKLGPAFNCSICVFAL